MHFKYFHSFLLGTLIILSSCNQDYHNIGSFLLVDQEFKTDIYKAPVFTYQQKLKRVQTDGLP
jgi:hypothetical protein